jgi:hypothetical protein
VPTLDPAPLDHSTAGTGTHAGTEAVLALTTSNVWLVRAFHERGFPFGRGSK